MLPSITFGLFRSWTKSVILQCLHFSHSLSKAKCALHLDLVPAVLSIVFGPQSPTADQHSINTAALSSPLQLPDITAEMSEYLHKPSQAVVKNHTWFLSASRLLFNVLVLLLARKKIQLSCVIEDYQVLKSCGLSNMWIPEDHLRSYKKRCPN